MILSCIIRLILSGLLGALIGLEREFRSKEAGFRTHFLVAVGSALIMLVSKYGFSDILIDHNVELDPSRIAAQVVSGIGFLGAGTIIIHKQFVRGLTTAAGIWATSGIGLTIGSGMYTVGISATILVFIGLEILNKFFKNTTSHMLTIEIHSESKESIKSSLDLIKSKNIEVIAYECKEQKKENDIIYCLDIRGKVKTEENKEDIYSEVQDFENIKSIRIE
ncbi:methyltransferase [Heyndrickxia sporothermodurans]|nr:methyltransferase [Heyndrickxia sporothermodurans]